MSAWRREADGAGLSSRTVRRCWRYCKCSRSATWVQLVPSPSVAPSTFCGEELGLSRREQQLVELLRERLTNKEIAVRLNLSEQTVKNHVHNILRKVGATERLAIV